MGSFTQCHPEKRPPIRFVSCSAYSMLYPALLHGMICFFAHLVTYTVSNRPACRTIVLEQSDSCMYVTCMYYVPSRANAKKTYKKKLITFYYFCLRPPLFVLSCTGKRRRRFICCCCCCCWCNNATEKTKFTEHAKTNAWENLEMNGKTPSARSGHRMVVWRNQLVLFGGFYETSRETKWFNDLYVMNFQDLK